MVISPGIFESCCDCANRRGCFNRFDHVNRLNRFTAPTQNGRASALRAHPVGHRAGPALVRCAARAARAARHTSPAAARHGRAGRRR
ncbi:hypothetical protein AQ809_09230 [Burkholderia pseudomallei]|nr:hypothetical protein AQ809_09230 [Burkholderia pseudomallei]